MYCDTPAKKNGADVEDAAFDNLEKMCAAKGIVAEHISKTDQYGFDVKLEYGGKEVIVDIKTPSGPNKNSGNMSVTYDRKNFGIVFIDGNVLSENRTDKKCAGIASKNPKDMGGFFLVIKSLTVDELFKELFGIL